MSPILSVRNLSTGYGKKQVLFDVGMDIMPGEVVLITGGNGSGKSTLLKAIYGLLPPWNADAKILFRPSPDSSALNTRPPSQNLSKGLGYLQQKNAVFDDLTVSDNLRLSGRSIRDRNQFVVRRDEVLLHFSALKPHFDRKPGRMSGGERQMLALAMVLLHRPRLLLLDEPLAGLDSKNACSLGRLIRGIHQERDLTLIIVEHRVDQFASVARRTIRLRLGVVTEGTP